MCFCFPFRGCGRVVGVVSVRLAVVAVVKWQVVVDGLVVVVVVVLVITVVVVGAEVDASCSTILGNIVLCSEREWKWISSLKALWW